MKRTMALLLLALLSLSLLLSGCTEQEPALDPETGHGDAPFMNSFYYDTVEELCEGLTSYFTGNVLQEYEDYYGAERGGVFRSFITNLQNGSVPLYVPCYQDEEVDFPNEDTRNNISLFPSDLYSKPWIWFSSNDYGVNCIYIMYLDEQIKEAANEKGATWLLREINPNGNEQDAKPYMNYDEMLEVNIVLQDRIVQGLSCSYDEDTRIFTYIVYDDILVLFNTSGQPSNAWLKDFSFEKIYLDE